MGTSLGPGAPVFRRGPARLYFDKSRGQRVCAGCGDGEGLAKVVFPRKWQAWPNWPRSHGTGTPFFGTKVEVVCPFVYTAIPSLHQQCPSSLSLTQRT